MTATPDRMVVPLNNPTSLPDSGRPGLNLVEMWLGETMGAHGYPGNDGRVSHPGVANAPGSGSNGIDPKMIWVEKQKTQREQPRKYLLEK